MKLNQSQRAVVVVFSSFAIYYFLFCNFQFIKLALDAVTRQGLLSYVLTYFLIGIPIFAGTLILNKRRSVLRALGLRSNIGTAIRISLWFALPMFIGGLIFFQFNLPIDVQRVIAGTIVAGFMEELYFRGFLFGQLFKNTKLGFIPSLVVGAVIFALGHLYQSQDIGELIGIFVITFAGAFFFAWLYVEWRFNLWVPILTHALMNLVWSLFVVDSSALGGVTANIFRGLTVLTAIVFTIVYKKKRAEPLAINRRTLMMKKSTAI